MQSLCNFVPSWILGRVMEKVGQTWRSRIDNMNYVSDETEICNDGMDL
jgi:hypothetical protein